MKNPFEKPDDRARLQHVLDAVGGTRATIDEFREWLAPQLDVDDDKGCSCIRDEVFELDTLMFSVYRLLHLVGSGAVTHLSRIDAHEANERVTAAVEGITEKIQKGEIQVKVIEAVPLPASTEDEGPGPNGAH